MDMRTRVVFPRPPSTKEEVYDPGFNAWLISCALVGRYDSKQHNIYRRLWAQLGDDLFRDILEDTRIIHSESHDIRCPAAFLTSQLAAGLL